MFQHEFTVRLSQTDAGGVVYFATYFDLAHQAYEAFLDTVLPVGQGLAAGILMPIVHAEADYHAPLRVSERVRVELRAVEVRRSSFTLATTLTALPDRRCAEVRTVHAVVGPDWKPRRLPADLAGALGSA